MTRVYLDWNATAPLRPEARAAMVAAMDVVGNPSSVHAEGRAAKALVERARAQVAEAVGCKPGEVVFTSGATEAAAFWPLPARHGGVCVEPTAHDALWAHFDLTLGRRRGPIRWRWGWSIPKPASSPNRPSGWTDFGPMVRGGRGRFFWT